MAEIGDVAERARPGVESVADRLDRIMRDGEIFDRDVADRKTRTGAKNPPVAMCA